VSERSPFRIPPAAFRAILIALPLLAIAIPLAVLAIPYLEILNDMAVQPKGKSQGLYGWFSDQALVVERPPPPGTVPMEPPRPVLGPKGEEGAKRAGRELVNPLPVDMPTLERGRKVYEIYCIVCHGKRAEGNGPIVGPGLFPAPPSLHTPQARGFPDGHIFHVISRGQKKMPSYADRIDPDERWAVVHYVRALQRAKTMSEKGSK